MRALSLPRLIFLCVSVCCQSAKSQVVYPGLDCFRNGKRLATPLDIPGIKEAGWTQAQLGPASQVGNMCRA
jgi:hypothetical protein